MDLASVHSVVVSRLNRVREVDLLALKEAQLLIEDR